VNERRLSPFACHALQPIVSPGPKSGR
jgi:hypothetical protein